MPGSGSKRMALVNRKFNGQATRVGGEIIIYDGDLKIELEI